MALSPVSEVRESRGAGAPAFARRGHRTAHQTEAPEAFKRVCAQSLPAADGRPGGARDIVSDVPRAALARSVDRLFRVVLVAAGDQPSNRKHYSSRRSCAETAR